MERLTEHHVNKSLGAYMVCSMTCDNSICRVDCKEILKIVDRLAAYEDTGMTPKQVRLISNVLQEVGETYNCLFDYVVNCVLENSHLKELAQAEKDGRLVVLPTNNLLTMDELREMDGEPVFIKNPEYLDCWALVRVRDKIMFTLNSGAMFPAELEFKCGGKAYRRKPEEEPQ